jgi:hypothetical protein
MFYTEDSKQTLLNLIMRDNPDLPFALTTENVVVEAITNVTPGPTNGQRNTSARIRGIQGAGFTGSVVVYYNRIDISKVILPNAYKISRAGFQITNFAARLIHEILDQLYLETGVRLRPYDVVNYGLDYASTPDRTATQGLVCQPSSPGFTGTVQLYIDRGKPTLENQLTVRELSQYKHADATAAEQNKQSAGLVTWGIDFTEHRSIVEGGIWNETQWNALRAILDSMGIPDYPRPLSNQVQTQNTTSVTLANKSFDRVTVHSGINADGIQGVAYYHYNNR